MSDEKSLTLGTSAVHSMAPLSAELKEEDQQREPAIEFKNEHSFTRNMYKDAIELFAQTLPMDDDGLILLF